MDRNGMVLLLTGVSPMYSAYVQSQAAMFMNSISSAADKVGMLHRFQYANYANEEQDSIASYGPRNEASLLAVAKKYDPSGVFQKLVQVASNYNIGRYKHGWDKQGNQSKELHN
jgi:hypothetical protein